MGKSSINAQVSQAMVHCRYSLVIFMDRGIAGQQGCPIRISQWSRRSQYSQRVHSISEADVPQLRGLLSLKAAPHKSSISFQAKYISESFDRRRHSKTWSKPPQPLPPNVAWPLDDWNSFMQCWERSLPGHKLTYTRYMRLIHTYVYNAYVYIYIYTCVYTCLWIYIYMCVYIYVCMYIYIYK